MDSEKYFHKYIKEEIVKMAASLVEAKDDPSKLNAVRARIHKRMSNYTTNEAKAFRDIMFLSDERVTNNKLALRLKKFFIKADTVRMLTMIDECGKYGDKNDEIIIRGVKKELDGYSEDGLHLLDDHVVKTYDETNEELDMIKCELLISLVRQEIYEKRMQSLDEKIKEMK